MKHFKFIWELLKESFIRWNNSAASKDAASTAYNAIFSLPGLLIIIVWVSGAFFGDEAIRGEINRQVGAVLGKDVGESVQGMVGSAVVHKDNVFMKIIGVAGLIFGATNLFFQMQSSLNALWDVQAAPKKAFQKYILDRANSLGMILIIAFLLLISLALTSLIGLANEFITRHFGIETYIAMNFINFVLGFIVAMILFAFMFKVLPDVEISWRSVWMGAFVTAVLFSIGKFLLGIYFDLAKPTSVFGAAGTVLLLMLWINYTCQIIFFGAEFTKVYADKMGHIINPSKHAKWSDAKLFKETLHKRGEGDT